MGIYPNGSIFGISIYTLNEDDYNINQLFEEKYDETTSEIKNISNDIRVIKFNK